MSPVRSFFLLLALTLILANETQPNSLSVIITITPHRCEMLDVAFYALSDAFSYYASNSPSFTAEVVVTALGEWNNSQMDSLISSFQRSTLHRHISVTMVDIIYNNKKGDSGSQASLASQINKAIFLSSGDVITLISHLTQVGEDFINPILQQIKNPQAHCTAHSKIMAEETNNCVAATSSETISSYHTKKSPYNIGIIGGLLKTPSGKIYEAGMNFRMCANVESKMSVELTSFAGTDEKAKILRNQVLFHSRCFNDFQWEEENVFIPSTIGLPVPRYRGETWGYLKATEAKEIPALSGLLVAFHRVLFLHFGGFDVSYEDHGYVEEMNVAFLDFQELVRQSGWEIRYDPALSAISHNDIHVGHKGENINDDITLLSARWGRKHQELAEEKFLSNVHVHYVSECGTSGVMGFTVEAINLLSELEAFLSLSVSAGDMKRCVKSLQEAGMQEHKLLMLYRLSEKIPGKKENTILFLHKDPGRYQHEINRNKIDYFYTVGRSMFETDRIVERWVSYIEKFVDEIWVPSAFNIDTFSSSGVPENKLLALGEGIDTFSFDPALPLSSFSPNLELITIHGDNFIQEDPFTFLTIMKFEVRKGWRELVSCFWSEFSETDNVRLVFRSKMIRYELEEFKNYVAELQESFGAGPPIYVVQDIVPFHTIAELYRNCDALVSAAHGEGWGLPLMEAMAMGLPVLAVNWSGNLEFMNEENSFLYKMEELTTTGAPYPDHQWAKIDEEDLKQKMRYVVEHPEERKEVGRKARKWIEEEWNLTSVALQFATQFKRIMDDNILNSKKQEYRLHKFQPDKKHTRNSQTTTESFTRNDKQFHKMKFVINKKN